MGTIPPASRKAGAESSVERRGTGAPGWIPKASARRRIMIINNTQMEITNNIRTKGERDPPKRGGDQNKQRGLEPGGRQPELAGALPGTPGRPGLAEQSSNPNNSSCHQPCRPTANRAELARILTRGEVGWERLVCCTRV
jgi:hypothetical protein